MRHRLLGAVCCGIVFLAALVIASPVWAESDDPRDEHAWCWFTNYDLPPDHISAADAVLQPDGFSVAYQFRVSPRLARAALTGPGGRAVSTETLARLGVPLWRATPEERAPDEHISMVQGENACLPYPLVSVTASTQPIVRGLTAFLVLETDRVAFCQVEYFDRVSPCYRGEDGKLYALIGISALIEAGTYEARLRLVSAGQERVMTFPLDVAPGYYGFQFIEPPPSLQALLDRELRNAEEDYLMRWRTMNSGPRLWDLPLGFPLEQSVSISADYGDRRSYGGMISGYHSGVDYRAWTGLPVVAPEDGTVVMAENLQTRGNAVLIDHGWGLVTGYWHLSRIDVQVGDRVRRGEPFALVGNTGLSTGSHLHWEVWVNGVSVDGKQWLSADTFGGVTVPPLEQRLFDIDLGRMAEPQP